MPRLSTDAPKPSCPHCGSQDSRVIDVTGQVATETIRRRRRCVDCATRWSTTEQIDFDSVTIPRDDPYR